MEPLDLGTKDAQQRLVRLYRYAQVGHCVNSVTHDVNNFLGAIMAYAELVGMESALPPESTRMIEEILGAVRKASNLMNGLTSIARRDKPNSNLVDPGHLVEHVVDLRRYDLRSAQIPIETNCDAGLPMVLLDEPKIELALIYLIANAMDAVRELPTRLIKVRVRGMENGVVIEVWNNGPVVPEEDYERIFEPFFTTWDQDHIGLGLTVARDIARLHGGDLSYDPSRGFILGLPRESAQKASGDLALR
ncbi:MAG: HAMP domain-containing sensor histidine kinase [FCB group bacterium]|nr:HAMP domain-containing sensor histidine kinase [FCB group bacterium]